MTDEDIISGVCDTANKFRNQLALLTQRVGMEAWMAIDPDDLDTIKRLLEWKYVGKNDGKDAGTQLRKTVELPSDAPF